MSINTPKQVAKAHILLKFIQSCLNYSKYLQGRLRFSFVRPEANNELCALPRKNVYHTSTSSAKLHSF